MRVVRVVVRLLVAGRRFSCNICVLKLLYLTCFQAITQNISGEVGISLIDKAASWPATSPAWLPMWTRSLGIVPAKLAPLQWHQRFRPPRSSFPPPASEQWFWFVSHSVPAFQTCPKSHGPRKWEANFRRSRRVYLWQKRANWGCHSLHYINCWTNSILQALDICLLKQREMLSRSIDLSFWTSIYLFAFSYQTLHRWFRNSWKDFSSWHFQSIQGFPEIVVSDFK